MADNRGSLGAQTFLLPQPQVRPQAPAQQPFNDGIQALEGLQHVEGQTTDYYKKVADLKAFMQSVHQNLGIDVRVPDLSRPESIKLNKIYRDALADVQSHGNMLKQSSAINNMLISRGDVLNDSYYGQGAATAQYGRDYFNRNLEPSIMELNNKLQMPSYTRQEYEQKELARKQAVDYWTQFIKDNPDKAAYGEYQLRGISPTTQGMWRPLQESSYDKKGRALDNAMEVAFRKATNFIQGTSPEWKSSTKPIPGTNRLYLENNEYAGLKYGDYSSPIKTAYLNPVKDQNGNTTGFFILNDGTQVEFNSSDPVPTLQKLADTNPRFGFTGAQMYDYAQRHGIYTGTGAVDISRYTDTPENQAKERERMRTEELDLVAKQDLIRNTIKDKTSKLQTRWFQANDAFTIPIKIGGAAGIDVEVVDEDARTFKIKDFTKVFKSLYIDKRTGKEDAGKKSQLKNKFDTPLSIEELVSNIIESLPKSQYDSILKDLGVKQEDIDKLKQSLGQEEEETFTTSGTTSATIPLTKGSLD